MAREVMNMLPLCCSATVELMSNMNVISHVRKSDIYAANEGCHSTSTAVGCHAGCAATLWSTVVTACVVFFSRIR